MTDPRSDILLSVVIPAYNESKRIKRTLSDVLRYFSHMEFGHEIIVVDDGSSDGTVGIVRAYEKRFPSLRLIANGRNRGKGYAVRCGMLEARGEYRLFMDADNSVTIDTVETFLDIMDESGYDVVIGSIAVPGARYVEHNGRHRRFLGSLSKWLIRLVAIPGIRDTQRGFKLFTRHAAEAIFPLQRIERFGFDVELLLIARKHGFSVKEMPVVWDNPSGSTLSPRAYFDSLVELGRILFYALAGKYNPLVTARREAKRIPNPSPSRKRIAEKDGPASLTLPPYLVE